MSHNRKDCIHNVNLIEKVKNSFDQDNASLVISPDRRDNRYTDHDLETLLRQRTYQIVAGYEDCNDANVVRKDPALKTAFEEYRNCELRD